MTEELKQIGLRLKGLRDALDMTQEEFSSTCRIPLEDYIEYEKGEKDISISTLKNIASQYDMDVHTLMFDDEPRMKGYSLTRNNKGMEIKRVEAYKYQALASGFTHRKADVFMVTVEPKPEDEPIYLNQHSGQEFNLVMEGRLLIQINGKDFILEEGDSMYFDPSLKHGMKAMDNKPVKFLAVVI